MGQVLGILTMAAQLGIESILVRPKRAIGPFIAQATIREVHSDELEITEHPVEMGAAITDHAYKRPAEVVIECVWGNSPQHNGLIPGLMGAVNETIGGVASILSGRAPSQSRDVYEKLLALQISRDPVDVFTGKRVYKNMLVKGLQVTTDRQSENILAVNVTLREIIIVRTQILRLGDAPASAQKIPQSTSPLIDRGTAQLRDGFPSVNADKAAESLTSSSVRDIAFEAVGGQQQLSGADMIFTPDL